MSRLRLGGVPELLIALMWITIAAAVVWVFTANAFTAEDPTPAGSKPTATSTPIKFINWTYQGQRCADGWSSSSIGQRGACSWHGGVVAVWKSPSGEEVACRVSPPLTEEALTQARSDDGRVAC